MRGGREDSLGRAYMGPACVPRTRLCVPERGVPAHTGCTRSPCTRAVHPAVGETRHLRPGVCGKGRPTTTRS